MPGQEGARGRGSAILDLADAGRLPVWPGDPPVVEGDGGVQGGGPTRESPSHGLLGESQDTASDRLGFRVQIILHAQKIKLHI